MTEENRTIYTSVGDYHEDCRKITDNKGNIVETVADIQKLLEQLEKTDSAETTTGKMIIATKAVEQIESDPSFKQRVLSALKAEGIAAFEQLLNHPAASFIIAAFKELEFSRKSSETLMPPFQNRYFPENLLNLREQPQSVLR